MQTFEVHQTGKQEGGFKEKEGEKKEEETPQNRVHLQQKKVFALNSPLSKKVAEERYVQCV